MVGRRRISDMSEEREGRISGPGCSCLFVEIIEGNVKWLVEGMVVWDSDMSEEREGRISGPGCSCLLVDQSNYRE